MQKQLSLRRQQVSSSEVLVLGSETSVAMHFE